MLVAKFVCNGITMWLWLNMTSLDKAPLIYEALSWQQKVYGGSRFISYKVNLLSCPWAQKLSSVSQWIQVRCAIKLLWAIFYNTPVTS